MILIIDDDMAVQASLLLLFENAGYSTMAASDQQKAMELLHHHPVSLVILDLNFSIDTSIFLFNPLAVMKRKPAMV